MLYFLCSYMVEKNRKLQNQFDTEASSSSSSEKSVFRGVSIFVDGITVPSSQVYFFSMSDYLLPGGIWLQRIDVILKYSFESIAYTESFTINVD